MSGARDAEEVELSGVSALAAREGEARRKKEEGKGEIKPTLSLLSLFLCFFHQSHRMPKRR